MWYDVHLILEPYVASGNRAKKNSLKNRSKEFGKGPGIPILLSHFAKERQNYIPKTGTEKPTINIARWTPKEPANKISEITRIR